MLSYFFCYPVLLCSLVDLWGSSHWQSSTQHFLPLVHVVHALNVSLWNVMFLQPLVQPPLTLQKTSPNTCPLSPPGKLTGGHGTAALGPSTYLSPLMSSQSTSREATCPHVVWVISSLQHLDAPGVCRIHPLPGEVKSSYQQLFPHLYLKYFIIIKVTLGNGQNRVISCLVWKPPWILCGRWSIIVFGIEASNSQ